MKHLFVVIGAVSVAFFAEALTPSSNVRAADADKTGCYYNDGGQTLGTCSNLEGSGYWWHCDSGHSEGEYSWEDATAVLGCERH